MLLALSCTKLIYFIKIHSFSKAYLCNGEQCINKNAFHKNKRPISIDKVEIRRIVLSKKDLYDKKGSFKYFIGYINKTDAFPVPLKLPQMNEYVKYFDSNNNYMNL